MFKLNVKVGIPLLIAIAIAMLLTFGPGPVSVSQAEARSCQNGWWFCGPSTVTQSTKCTWDFGCWANPYEPNNVFRNCTTTTTPRCDALGSCNAKVSTNCSSTGRCCN